MKFWKYNLNSQLKFFYEIANNQNLGQEKCQELYRESPHYEEN